MTRALLLAIALLMGSACSVLGSFDECATDGDCASAYDNRALTCEAGVCTPPSLASMLSRECTATYADPSRPGREIVGVIVSALDNRAPAARDLIRGIELATDEINATQGVGDFSLVMCAGPTEESAVAAARHLTGELGARAIVLDADAFTLESVMDAPYDERPTFLTLTSTSRFLLNDRQRPVWMMRPPHVGLLVGNANYVSTNLVASRSLVLLNSSDDDADEFFADLVLDGPMTSPFTELRMEYENPSSQVIVYYKSSIKSSLDAGALDTQLARTDTLVLMGRAEVWDDFLELVTRAFSMSPRPMSVLLGPEVPEPPLSLLKTLEELRFSLSVAQYREAPIAASQTTESFLTRYLEAYNVVPGRAAALGYDGLWALAIAGGVRGSRRSRSARACPRCSSATTPST